MVELENVVELENMEYGIAGREAGLKVTAGCWPVKMTGQTKF